MNVYDFDGTIYCGDSTVDFFLYTLQKKPSLVRFIPTQIWGFILYRLKYIDKTRLKEYFFCFLAEINAIELSEFFWDRNHGKIYSWYLQQHMYDDIIISASPEFLLRPICKRLGINYLIASVVDPNSGVLLSKNCRGEEKVRRLAAEYHVTCIDKFYSDSISDMPLAMIADEAFLVENGKVRVWKIQRA